MKLNDVDVTTIAQARTLAGCEGADNIRAFLTAHDDAGGVMDESVYPRAFGWARSLLSSLIGIIDYTPRSAGPDADLRVEDFEHTVTSVQVKHPGYREGHRVRMVVDVGTSAHRSTWLSPDEAETLAAHLLDRAAEARRRNTEDHENSN